MMDEELKNYLLSKCYHFFLDDEITTLRRFSLTVDREKAVRKIAQKSEEWESRYGFRNEVINNLIVLGIENLKNKIANRLLKEHPELLNFCPKCNKLARTPKARQCRHCQHKWFDKPIKEYTK